MTHSLFKLLRKLHRRLGVFLAVFLLVLAMTGILLNHTETLGLDDAQAPAWLARYYLGDTEASGYRVADRYLYALGGWLYADTSSLATCQLLQGAVRLGGQVFVLCDSELLLFTSDWQLIEKMGSALGLPADAARLGELEGKLILGVPGEAVAFDTESLASTRVTGPVNWAALVTIPAEVLLADSINWQQVVLDLHSGAILGAPGKVFVDLVGGLSILLAVTGLIMWRSPNRNGRQRMRRRMRRLASRSSRQDPSTD